MAAISSSNTAFALNLFRTLSQAEPSENIFVSPLSISSAMAMVYLGARGNTATQMALALSLGSGQCVHTDFQALHDEINSPCASYTLKLANRLYGETTAEFLTEFLEDTKKYYSANLKSVDFIGAPEACRAEINSWVEEQTSNKIKDLLKPGKVNTMTRLALVNAIYFKGNWENQFKVAVTSEMPFKVNQNESRPVQMMHQKQELPFSYIPEHKLKILELPYVKKELSMVILLPDDSLDGSDPLKKVEAELTPENLDNWTNSENMDQSEVMVYLPKFKLEEDYELNGPLASLGMTDVFCAAKADLSGMGGGGGLFLSAVAHKAFVEVNEEGTEAAAATAGMVAFCMVMHPEEFKADHPFLFFIRHNKSKSILFFGRFSSPQ